MPEANSDWYFFEDDILNAATYKRWRQLSVQELTGERDAITKKLEGAWGYNEGVREKLTALLVKFEDYYNHRMEIYEKELEEYHNGKKTQD